ncbi:MAG: hypothetical protein ACM3PV_15195 [Betaproteobacteria bacterium]
MQRATEGWGDALRETLPLGAIALAVTLLRLAGERLRWSEAWFSRETGGIVPSRLGWVVGITWLALPFGAWLAARLVARGEAPTSSRRAIGLAFLGAVLFLALLRLAPQLGLGFPTVLLAIWAAAVAGAAVAWVAWPALARVLLVYGLLSRVPVVVVMFLALRARWGTHYDYADSPMLQQMPFWTGFTWLALFPQLVFWVGFTIIAGLLAGTLTGALSPARGGRR